MTDADPRLQHVIRFEGGNRPARVVGPQIEGFNGALNVMVRDLAAVASSFRRTEAEVSGHSSLLPSERGQKLAQAAAPLMQALRKAAQTYANEFTRIQSQAAAATATPPYGDTTHLHVILTDQLLAQRFAAMAPTAREIMIHEATHTPEKVKRWGEMLQRLDPEVTGISHEVRDVIRLAFLRSFDPATSKMIASELTHAEQAHEALEIAVDILREGSPGSVTELRTVAPEVFDVIEGHRA